MCDCLPDLVLFQVCFQRVCTDCGCLRVLATSVYLVAYFLIYKPVVNWLNLPFFFGQSQKFGSEHGRRHFEKARMRNLQSFVGVWETSGCAQIWAAPKNGCGAKVDKVDVWLPHIHLYFFSTAPPAVDNDHFLTQIQTSARKFLLIGAKKMSEKSGALQTLKQVVFTAVVVFTVHEVLGVDVIVWQRFCEPARLRITYCPWVRPSVFRVLSATSH